MLQNQGLWCLQDYFFFCIFALVLQLLVFFLFVSKASRYEPSGQDVFQRVVDNFIRAWPMSAPTMIISALACRIGRLKIHGIDTLQPGKLEIAGLVQVVCFDKTGTLTNNVVSYLTVCVCPSVPTTPCLDMSVCTYQALS